MELARLLHLLFISTQIELCHQQPATTIFATPHSDVTVPTNRSKPAFVPDTKITCEAVSVVAKRACFCRLSDTGKLVDISSLGQSGASDHQGPRFVTRTLHDWYMGWSPCKDFSMNTNTTLLPGDEPCINVGFARFTNLSSKICEGYGQHSTSAFEIFGRDTYSRIKLAVMFSNRSTDPERKARIDLICDSSEKTGRLEYVRYIRKKGVQYLKFYSKCCCEDGCVQDPPHHPYVTKYDIIAGTVSFFVVLVLVVLGIVLYRRRRQRNRIPEEHDEHQGLVAGIVRQPQEN